MKRNRYSGLVCFVMVNLTGLMPLRVPQNHLPVESADSQRFPLVPELTPSVADAAPSAHVE